MTKSMPFRMLFEKYDDKPEWKPNGRLMFMFQVADQDVIRLFSLLAMTKEKNLRKDIFGKATFTVQMIPTKEKDKDTGLTTTRASYIDMI